MMSNPNYETQKDEMELLKNILFEQLAIKEEFPHFIFEISIIPDVIEEPKLKFVLKFNLPEEYPNSTPIFEINDISNYLASARINILIDSIKTFVEENLGMPMIYQIYEMVKDFGNEQEEIMNTENLSKLTIEEENKRKIFEKMQKMDLHLIETKTFTPVTKENYEAWFKKYYAEINKGKEKKKEQEARISGREFFMKMKMANNENVFGDIDEGEDGNNEVEVEVANPEKKEDAMFFDADAFEENIEDIDFEGIDVEDDE